MAMQLSLFLRTGTMVSPPLKIYVLYACPQLLHASFLPIRKQVWHYYCLLSLSPSRKKNVLLPPQYWSKKVTLLASVFSSSGMMFKQTLFHDGELK